MNVDDLESGREESARFHPPEGGLFHSPNSETLHLVWGNDRRCVIGLCGIPVRHQNATRIEMAPRGSRICRACIAKQKSLQNNRSPSEEP